MLTKLVAASRTPAVRCDPTVVRRNQAAAGSSVRVRWMRSATSGRMPCFKALVIRSADG